MSNILVIDDEEPITNMLALALTNAGYEVEVASNGLDGLDKYNSGYFDLVITDIVMPGINGNEVARDIKKSHNPQTPVIGMSGTPWELSDEQFDEVLPKPFSLMTLFNTVQAICHEPV